MYGTVSDRLATAPIVTPAAILALALAATWLAGQAGAQTTLLLDCLADAGDAPPPRATIAAVVVSATAVRRWPTLEAGTGDIDGIGHALWEEADAVRATLLAFRAGAIRSLPLTTIILRAACACREVSAGSWRTASGFDADFATLATNGRASLLAADLAGAVAEGSRLVRRRGSGTTCPAIADSGLADLVALVVLAAFLSGHTGIATADCTGADRAAIGAEVGRRNAVGAAARLLVGADIAADAAAEAARVNALAIAADLSCRAACQTADTRRRAIDASPFQAIQLTAAVGDGADRRLGAREVREIAGARAGLARWRASAVRPAAASFALRKGLPILETAIRYSAAHAVTRVIGMSVAPGRGDAGDVRVRRVARRHVTHRDLLVGRRVTKRLEIPRIARLLLSPPPALLPLLLLVRQGVKRGECRQAKTSERPYLGQQASTRDCNPQTSDTFVELISVQCAPPFAHCP